MCTSLQPDVHQPATRCPRRAPSPLCSRYYNALSDWARVQLVSHNQHVHIYKTISEHYLETSMTPAPLSLSDFSNFQARIGHRLVHIGL